ncbi:BRCA1-associated RING domain protein 1 [Cornus florida]|uniref:BRCA1-associated RING domain protein 1 n=1 Tax=Cornus florida TaxID=4283 RepID=UPI00289B7FB6|nr:BRCA1-associated RING domain protein 1 [Cornus florida]
MRAKRRRSAQIKQFNFNFNLKKPLMADTSNHARFLNPWLLQFQKMGLELICPLCLKMLNRPMLLPCDHIICHSCMPTSTQFGSECPVCKQQYSHRDVRPAPYMENMVTIYRSLDAAFMTSCFQPASSDVGRVPNDGLSKEAIETREGNSSNGQSRYSLTSNRRVQATLNQSVQDGIESTVKNDKSRSPRTTCVEESDMCARGPVVLHGEGKLTPAKSPGWVGAVKHNELGIEQVDIDQVTRSSSGSPPSFGDTKDMDDINDPGCSNAIPEKFPAKRIITNHSDKAGGEMNGRPSPGTEFGHARNAKRQKKLNYGISEKCAKSNAHAQSAVLHSESTGNSGVEHKFGGPFSSKAYTSVCAFCRSSKLTDRSGPMLHYANGKEVIGDAATHPNVIHVHKTCIEWTPQAYYDGETVMNLEAEVARAAKLKCSSCGIKGAALGCFVKHCKKSYHALCAVDLDCRWDCEDFLLLCPNHCSAKFPSENSKSEKNSRKKENHLSSQITVKQSDFWAAEPNGAKEWLLCGSALSVDEKYLLVKFASICGATVSKFWKPSVTHVIAATDANGACSRTLKVLMAILNGKWILTIDWIKACMEAKKQVEEEPYEVSLDSHGCCDGPKNGRLRVSDNAPKLFNGLDFYFCGDFLAAYKEDLLALVKTAGGSIIESREKLVAQSNATHATSSTTLVVYNLDPPQGCQPGEGRSFAAQRLEKAQYLANEIGCKVIGHTWLLESIAACKLRPFAH